MSAVPFDTLKFSEALEAGGFTHQQARAAAIALAEVGSTADLATRQDIVSVKRDLVELEQRLTIRLGGMLVVAVGVLLAAVRYLPASHP